MTPSVLVTQPCIFTQSQPTWKTTHNLLYFLLNSWSMAQEQISVQISHSFGSGSVDACRSHRDVVVIVVVVNVVVSVTVCSIFQFYEFCLLVWLQKFSECWMAYMQIFVVLSFVSRHFVIFVLIVSM